MPQNQTEQSINKDEANRPQPSEPKRSSKKEKVHFWLLIIIAVLMLAFAIWMFIPCFSSIRYIYPIPEGQDTPDKEYFYYSVIMGTLEAKSPLGIICLLLNVTVAALAIVSIVLKNRSYSSVLRIITYVLFVVMIYICFITVMISGQGYAVDY